MWRQEGFGRLIQVPFVRRVAKEEEVEEAREEVREKRRGTSASLAAGSTAGEGSGRRRSQGGSQAAREREWAKWSKERRRLSRGGWIERYIEIKGENKVTDKKGKKLHTQFIDIKQNDTPNYNPCKYHIHYF